jgi:hypothetical protein
MTQRLAPWAGAPFRPRRRRRAPAHHIVEGVAARSRPGPARRVPRRPLRPRTNAFTGPRDISAPSVRFRHRTRRNNEPKLLASCCGASTGPERPVTKRPGRMSHPPPACRGLQARQRDPADAGYADGLGRGLGEVDDAAMGVRPAVVDAHYHRAARALIRHPDP